MAERETLRSITRDGFNDIKSEITRFKETADRIVNQFSPYDALQHLSPSIFQQIFSCMRVLNHLEDQILSRSQTEFEFALKEEMVDMHDGSFQMFQTLLSTDESLTNLYKKLDTAKQHAEAFVIVMQLRLEIIRCSVVRAGRP